MSEIGQYEIAASIFRAICEYKAHKDNITVAVPRSYKNANGEYDADFIHCTLWEGVAEKTITYVKKGDLLGIKGHIQSRTIQFDEDYKRNVVEIVADKVTFLSSKRSQEEK